MSFESVSTQTDSPDKPALEVSPIASFWRRLGAFLADCVMLGICGYIIALILSPAVYSLGPYGRLIGLPIALAYFGLMDSHVANGQTLGKRLLKIAVRSKDNNAISPQRSLLRSSIWIVPVLMNGWGLPILRIAVLQWLQGIIIFGVGGAILYTMIFNRRARQGLHDLACGTYVVHLAGNPIESFPRTARIHLRISGALLLLVVVGTTLAGLLASSFVSSGSLANASRVYRALRADDRFFDFSVQDLRIHKVGGESARVLQINGWYKGLAPGDERFRAGIIQEIAAVVLKDADNVGQYDQLIVSVSSAYDIGIATRRRTFGDAEPVAVWQQRVNPSTL